MEHNVLNYLYPCLFHVQLSMWSDALHLARKSLTALPTFLSALEDLVYIQLRLGNRNAAEYALEQLKAVGEPVDLAQLAAERLTPHIANMLW